jgi:hypothetical protein
MIPNCVKTVHSYEQPPFLIQTNRNKIYIYNLWALYDASGPNTNSSGYPIQVKLLEKMSPAAARCDGECGGNECVNRRLFNSSLLTRNEMSLAVPCSGAFSRQHFEGNYVDSLSEKTFNAQLLERLFNADRSGQLDRLKNIPALI